MSASLLGARLRLCGWQRKQIGVQGALPLHEDSHPIWDKRGPAVISKRLTDGTRVLGFVVFFSYSVFFLLRRDTPSR